ncbi:MAG: HAD family hydrolase [Lachnospiraceae bacterium]|nr:HAD family hydrolase [Lachnospiraceae bacterium]
MSYKYIIFDVDDTLLDYGSAFHTAQRAIADYLEVEYSKEYIALSEKLGWKAWQDAGLNDTDSVDVQKNYHSYYFQYLRQHYRDLIEAYHANVNVEELVELYIERVTSNKVCMEENTLQVYRELARKYKLVLATNGIARIQRERIEAFLPYTCKTYISENMNTIKPAKAFFQYIINDLECEPKECLMVGDSISNDIVGALDAGMDVCYYNIKNKSIPEGISVNYEITSIEEILNILG